MKRATVIINPISGGNRTKAGTLSSIALARTTLTGQGFEAHVHVTSATGDAHEVATDAVRQGTDVVVAWGGDGTINEVASALAFGPVPLGIVPAGSGNGLALELGVPADPVGALTVATGTSARWLDAGDINGALFFNVAGIGLDAGIAKRFAARGPGRRGPAAYVQLTAIELLRWRSRRYSLRFNGLRIERRALMITLANSRQYGNGALIAPRALLDDGLIDVVVVEEQSLFRILAKLPQLFRGTLSESPGVLMRSTSELEIEAEGPLDFHVDGEPRCAAAVLKVRVHARSLRVKAGKSAE